MSFLDSLENNLKALESLEATGLDDRRRREADKARSLASAPWAERLKTSPWVRQLMGDLTRAGFARRTKIHFVWIGTTLRLEAMDQRVDLEPTPRGIEAVFAGRRVPVDLDGKPEALIRDWMSVLDAEILRRQAAQADLEKTLAEE